MTHTIPQDILDAFVAVVGEKNVLDASDDLSHYTHENRDIFIGRTPLVLKPATTREVAEIVCLANKHNIAIVPQGGHTGHAAGGVPDDSGTQIVVALERMNKIRDLDLDGNTAIVEAGCVLNAIQKLADENNRLFPLSLASEGSCQIGGNISTNAGGTGVLAYGNTRAMILGLEVVTPTGEIWDGLRRLKKDNTGYDLRDLFIGAEGTLGIITAAVVKLFPKPKGKVTAFVGLDSPESALDLFQHATEQAGKSLTAFEFLPRIGIDAVLELVPDIRDPLETKHSWYVLMEISSGRSQNDATEVIENILETAISNNVAENAAISQNETQRQALWSIRETMPASQKLLGGSVKNDISVPVHLVPEFLEKAGNALADAYPKARIFAFGHMGDGNIHYNISQPKDEETDGFLARRKEINDIVTQVVLELDGSISAEHGIGKLKRDLLVKTKSPVEMQMMYAIKQAFDPNGIMNPGKVV